MGYLDWYLRRLVQTITYWVPAFSGGWNEPSGYTRSMISGRWEDKIIKFVDSAGNDRDSRAVIYVSEIVNTTGWLFLGTSITADPREVVNAFPIRKTEQYPTLRGNFINKALL